MSKQTGVGDDFEQLVVFQLSNEFYGVDIGDVNTIIRMQEVTQVPQTPSFVEGVINLRGSIIPVIDLRKRFALEVGAITKSSRIVVVEATGQMIGMIVDAVAETLRIHTDSIEPPSPVIAGIDVEYLRGIGKIDDRLLILLNLDKVLTGQETDVIKKMDSKLSSSETAAMAA
jgi:purine-binding chemotaxis protein CheW